MLRLHFTISKHHSPHAGSQRNLLKYNANAQFTGCNAPADSGQEAKDPRGRAPAFGRTAFSRCAPSSRTGAGGAGSGRPLPASRRTGQGRDGVDCIQRQ